MNVLIIFMVLKTAKAVLESWLSLLNRDFYRDRQRIAAAKLALNISDSEFAKISSYTEAKFKYGMTVRWLGLIVLLAFVAFGGLSLIEAVSLEVVQKFGGGAITEGLVFWGILGLLSILYAIPFELYSIFVIEEAHGFNRQSLRGFCSDKVKELLVSAILGSALLALVIFVMDSTSDWWLWAWIVITLFSLLVSWIYPSLLAPLFNKFSPLEKGELRDEIFKLAKKVDFRTNGLFVMDASVRSTHGNAYFTGMFGKKRIVLFDNLLEVLSVQEIVAVLAHELGHFKLNHVRWGLARSIILMGVVFFVMSKIVAWPFLYDAFGLRGYTPHTALLVFMLWYDIVQFLFTPVAAWLSRSNEFAADAFARKCMQGGQDLCNALVKLQKRNHSMPITHPLFSRFYYSHPPILERIDVLNREQNRDQ